MKIAAVPGMVSAFYRLAFAAPPLLVAWIANKKPLPARHDLLLIAVGGALFAGDLPSGRKIVAIGKSLPQD